MTADNTTRPFVSVIICACNEEELLGQLLDSLAGQTYPKECFEVIIIDDESTDRTGEIAKSFIERQKGDPLHISYCRIEHSGLAIARNTGIGIAHGDIIAFIDGDAVADREWLDKLVVPFANGADYTGGRIDLFNTDSRIAQTAQVTEHIQSFDPEWPHNNLVGCNMAFRKNIFEAGYGFFENFTSRGDDTTLLYTIKNKYQYLPAPDAKVLHMRSTSIKKWLREDWHSSLLLGMIQKNETIISTGHINSWLRKAALASLPLMIAGTFISLYMAIPLVFVLLVSFKSFYLRPFGNTCFHNLVRLHGKLSGAFVFIIFIYLYCLTRAAGQAVGFLGRRLTRIIPPYTTQPTVLEQKP